MSPTSALEATRIFQHQDDDTNFTNDIDVIDFEDSAEWYGSVTPDSSGGSGDYSISVVLKSLRNYGQLPDCETVAANATGNNTDPNATAEDITYLHFCEVTFYADDAQQRRHRGTNRYIPRHCVSSLFNQGRNG